MSDLRVLVDGHELTASWSDNNQATQDALAEALPLGGEATRWGDELYFGTDVDVPPEETQTAVPVGTVAYWPDGNALCLFWGETPASHENEPRAAAPVTVVAEIADTEPLQDVTGGTTVRVEEQ
ncbi:cyclophilin-like fold protein [Haloarcula sp. S1CR25-12]|uniref:Cyclophilin-like fold protein n=1 Tax=Haloarcula saliterrae TaxID=2950534 RepID=A0ABU2FEB0_9EURY|nr:cyclophilin-like fold protein [Haloarcula sp. S1CR25-12]MDS0260557.1 cyclophilin-like fold protein [Haloarcula sp. S1CR25-12]